MKYENYQYKKSNREKRLTPKLGKHWCYKCDMSWHNPSSPCKRCGAKPHKSLKKYKKESIGE